MLCNGQSGLNEQRSFHNRQALASIRFSTFGLDCFQLICQRCPSRISNMIFFRLLPVLLIFFVTTVDCALNKCTTEQTCVEINRCHERCAKIEQVGGTSRLPEDEKADFKKSICGFQKDDPMVCCKAPSDSPLCGIRSGLNPKPRGKVFAACGRIQVKAN